MLKWMAAVVAAGSVLASMSYAQQREGDYLYHVTTVRAAPGKLEALLKWVEEVDRSSFVVDAGVHRTYVMRHSQGDQWDLLFIGPMESWTAFHKARATRKREKAYEKHGELLGRAGALVAFQEDHFAFGPPLDELKREYAENSFYHIEMFKAAPGKAGALFEQRQMENAYLAATGQTTNMIFRRAAGSDIDVFTIGFHDSMKAFAADAPASDEEKEQAAKDAGFKDRADLSFYLRSLISGHHDTLAVKVE